ncbi:hypothetical protein EBB07_33925 [Paenibacillaceae bacterium]|nr:hypothetical protein EBB07_33925 [Paenibacillaceae bacterium]
MITVRGQATITVDFEVKLDMTEEEFDSNPPEAQNDIINHRIDWLESCRAAELDGIDIFEVE